MIKSSKESSNEIGSSRREWAHINKTNMEEGIYVTTQGGEPAQHSTQCREEGKNA